MNWGIKQTAVAGLVLSVGQMLAVINFVFPRTEAEELKKQVFELSQSIRAVDTKHDAKADRMYDKLDEIRNEIRRLVELQLEKKK